MTEQSFEEHLIVCLSIITELHCIIIIFIYLFCPQQ